MRKSVVATLLIACCFIFSAGNVGAVTLAFEDTQYYWPGWNNGSDDGKDTIGTPDILGGKAEISAGSYLTKLTFEVTPEAYLGLWYLLYPGDLFIDADADKTWDYYVDLVDSIPDGNGTPGTGHLYSINQPLNSGGYLKSCVPSGYGYRETIPWVLMVVHWSGKVHIFPDGRRNHKILIRWSTYFLPLAARTYC